MSFKVTDLVLRLDINYRDNAHIEMLGCGGNSIHFDIDACGRTNKTHNELYPDFEFAGRMSSIAQFERLRTALRELSKRLDAIPPEDLEEAESLEE